MVHFKINKKWGPAVILAIIMVVGIVGTVSAAEFPPGGQIPAGQTLQDDVFLSATNVSVDGTVEGTIIAAGQTVTVNGVIHGDALLVGEKVIVNNGATIDGNVILSCANATINGTITGSLFGGSASIELGDTATIGRNLYYGGYSLQTSSGSVITKDLFTGAYQALLSGSVGRDANIAAGAVELNGSIARNATFNVGNENDHGDPETSMQFMPGRQYFPVSVPAGIRIAKSAHIGGNLSYSSSIDQSATFKPLTTGQVIYQTPVPQNISEAGRQSGRRETNPFWVTTLWSMASRLITFLALGSLAIWLAKKYFLKVTDAGYQKPAQSLAWGFIVAAVGFLVLCVTPVAFVLLAILLGFISLGGLIFTWVGVVGTAILLAILLFLFILFTVSKIVAAYMLGKWIVPVLFPHSADNSWLRLIIGVVIYVLLAAIPLLGWLVGLGAALVGTGAVWLTIRSFRSETEQGVKA